MPQNSTFVLVPGAWHGGWAWNPVATRLRAAGHDALAVTMPGLSSGDDPRGLGMADAVAHLVTEIERRDLTDVVLVGHSWGGAPITAAAHQLPRRISAVIYYSAVVPERGVAMNDELSAENAAYARALIAGSPDGSMALPFEAFAQVLMQDQPEPLQRVVFDLLLPQPARYLPPPTHSRPAPPPGIRTAYVLAEDDRALARPGTEFAARIGVEPVLVPGTHESLLTHPDELAKALLTV